MSQPTVRILNAICVLEAIIRSAKQGSEAGQEAVVRAAAAGAMFEALWIARSHATVISDLARIERALRLGEEART